MDSPGPFASLKEAWTAFGKFLLEERQSGMRLAEMKLTEIGMGFVELPAIWLLEVGARLPVNETRSLGKRSP